MGMRSPSPHSRKNIPINTIDGSILIPLVVCPMTKRKSITDDGPENLSDEDKISDFNIMIKKYLLFLRSVKDNKRILMESGRSMDACCKEIERMLRDG